MPSLTRSNLHDYQKEIVEKAKEIPNLGLFLPPGLGKTATTLTIIAEQFKGKTLIIAPKRVAESVWSDEIPKWAHTKDLTIVKVMGSPAQRTAALKSEANIYIINLENVAWLFKDFMVSNIFDNLVIDESSRFKDPSTKRFKALKSYLKTFKRKIILTGTPTPQGYADLWSQVGILDLGQRLETSYTKFKAKYMCPAERNYHTNVIYKWGLIENADKQIQDKIKDICFSLKAEDYLKLPEVTKVYHRVQMHVHMQEQYDTLRKELVLETGRETITAVSAAALTNKLLQFTSGFLYNEGKEAVHQHDAKLDYLEDLWDEETPTLVFYHFQNTLKSLKTRFKDIRVLDDNPQTLIDWRAGKIKMLVAHPQSGGIGINLQCNVADTAQMVWFDLPWSSENYIQANARIHRQGQEKPVIIHHLVIDESIDEHVVQVLEGKINVQQAVLNALDFALV
jgi:SNF2 family DNA or RNA helicase